MIFTGIVSLFVGYVFMLFVLHLHRARLADLQERVQALERSAERALVDVHERLDKIDAETATKWFGTSNR